MKKLFILGFVLAIGLYLKFSILPYVYSDQQGINPSNISEQYSPIEQFGSFHGSYFTAPHDAPVAVNQEKTNVLGATTNPNKRIEINLTNQQLYAFEGEKKIYEFPISSGLWGKTPTGEFRIWIKLRYTRMTGGNKAWGTYYDLPNVPFTMFFSNAAVPAWRGFGIHGAYWHNNFGHPMSHGCINMKTEDVEKIYYWADPDLMGKTSINANKDNPGTRIVIYGTAPNE
jgi:lipoprotein-anchoring transpeptidase ErfK/SrfK